MKKKRIRFTITNLGGGGAEKVLITLLNRLKIKYNIELFLVLEEGVYLNQIPNNIKVYYIFPDYKSKNLFQKIKNSISYRIKNKIYCKNKKILYTRNNCDIEIAFLEGLPTELVSQSSNKFSKKIAWIHTDLLKHRSRTIEEERKYYEKFDEVICVSEGAKISFEKLFPEYKAKVSTIYNPINKEEVLEKSKEKIKNFKKEKITLLTAGRLIDAKGYDLLLKAHKELLEEGLDYDLLIIGEGEKKEEFENYIKENNIFENTKLLDFKENPYSYMNAADIFISSSRYEGFSLVLCEALILEKPVIATKCTGPIEILEKGKYGILIPTESIEELKKSIRAMVLDKGMREKYSKLARERKDIFDINLVMSQIENLFLK